MSEPREPQPPHRPGPPGRDRAPATPQNEPSRTPLPKDTVEALRAAGGAGRCSNLSLALNRLNDAWGPGFARLDDRLSRKFLQDCTAIPQQDAARRLHQDYLRRHEAMLDAYQRGLWRCLRVRGRLVSRFISGLGLANPL